MEAHGWRLFAHPLFHAQMRKLSTRAQKLEFTDPSGYASHPVTKLPATINHYVKNAIPGNPNGQEFRQGNTLGADNRHWFRAKFHGRYRLFYRFSTEQKIIIYVWVNDEGTLRKSGSKTDPYAVFKGMLESGDPPSSFARPLLTAKTLE
jgi:toxin YhaV